MINVNFKQDQIRDKVNPNVWQITDGTEYISLSLFFSFSDSKAFFQSLLSLILCIDSIESSLSSQL